MPQHRQPCFIVFMAHYGEQATCGSRVLFLLISHAANDSSDNQFLVHELYEDGKTFRSRST